MGGQEGGGQEGGEQEEAVRLQWLRMLIDFARARANDASHHATPTRNRRVIDG